MASPDTDSQLSHHARFGRFAMIAIPYAWLLIFFLVPFFIVFKISFSSYAISIPPYEPVFDILNDAWSTTLENIQLFSLDTYQSLFEDSLFIRAYLSSVWIAALSTFFTLLVAYPMAYGMARASKAWRPTLLMLVILPFWTSFLIRVYAWIGILSREGLLNQALAFLGLIDPANPPTLLNTDVAVYIGIVYSYLPFMVLPLYAALEKMDETLLEAASDLGCPPWKAFWTITFPLSIPGVVAGCFLVFIPATGEYVIPSLLGGSNTLMIGRVLWDVFSADRDWPMASAVAVILLLVLVIPIVIFQNQQQKMQEEGK